MEEYALRPIGFIRSGLKNVADAPRFYTEGAPSARLELLPAFREGLDRVETGQDIIVITWLHLAQRDVLKVHPQGDLTKPLTGVFLTRSPDRPNPLGLHRCAVLALLPDGLAIGPIEAVDGTPVVDIKPVVAEADDS
jgi:tRNA-Thr(GGU) m(6)t(6)A37 methyltransferase TsaA